MKPKHMDGPLLPFSDSQSAVSFDFACHIALQSHVLYVYVLCSLVSPLSRFSQAWRNLARQGESRAGDISSFLRNKSPGLCADPEAEHQPPVQVLLCSGHRPAPADHLHSSPSCTHRRCHCRQQCGPAPLPHLTFSARLTLQQVMLSKNAASNTNSLMVNQ